MPNPYFTPLPEPRLNLPANWGRPRDPFAGIGNMLSGIAQMRYATTKNELARQEIQEKKDFDTFMQAGDMEGAMRASPDRYDKMMRSKVNFWLGERYKGLAESESKQRDAAELKAGIEYADKTFKYVNKRQYRGWYDSAIKKYPPLGSALPNPDAIESMTDEKYEFAKNNILTAGGYAKQFLQSTTSLQAARVRAGATLGSAYIRATKLFKNKTTGELMPWKPGDKVPGPEWEETKATTEKTGQLFYDKNKDEWVSLPKTVGTRVPGNLTPMGVETGALKQDPQIRSKALGLAVATFAKDPEKLSLMYDKPGEYAAQLQAEADKQYQYLTQGKSKFPGRYRAPDGKSEITIYSQEEYDRIFKK